VIIIRLVCEGSLRNRGKEDKKSVSLVAGNLNVYPVGGVRSKGCKI
jgi:hypothetical protein